MTISPMKDHLIRRQKREDLLSFYLRMQDEKKPRSSKNKEDEIFTLPCPDSLRRGNWKIPYEDSHNLGKSCSQKRHAD